MKLGMEVARVEVVVSLTISPRALLAFLSSSRWARGSQYATIAGSGSYGLSSPGGGRSRLGIFRPYVEHLTCAWQSLSGSFPSRKSRRACFSSRFLTVLRAFLYAFFFSASQIACRRARRISGFRSL